MVSAIFDETLSIIVIPTTQTGAEDVSNTILYLNFSEYLEYDCSYKFAKGEIALLQPVVP